MPSTLCKRCAGHKLYEQPFDVQGCCVVHQHVLRVIGTGYHLVNVQGKKTYTAGQKSTAQELKDRRMMKTDLLAEVPEHFSLKHPPEALHPSFRGRPVAFPLAKRHCNLSPLMGRTQSLLFPNLSMPCTRIY